MTGTHTQMRAAAHPQGPVGNSERGADLGQGRWSRGRASDHFFEPYHDFGTLALRRVGAIRGFSNQTLDQRPQQLLFQPMCGLIVDRQPRASRRGGEGIPVQVDQGPERIRRRLPPAISRLKCEPASTHGMTESNKVIGPNQHRAPAAWSVRSFVEAKAGAVRYDLSWSE